MNRIVWATIIFASWLPPQAWSQGEFFLDNATALTRLGSLDGPLAGPGIWGQALVGTTERRLSPLGPPRDHMFGLLRGIALAVPGLFAGDSVFVQMAAWDGTVWGDSLADVPANQIGYTDVLSIGLVMGGGTPLQVTRFTTPAVVPPVPEPDALVMTVVGGMAVMVAAPWRRRRRMGRL